MRKSNLALVLLVFFTFACEKENLTQDAKITDSQRAAGTQVQKVDVMTFQEAGALGGIDNVLTPGDFFTPGPNSFASLKRGKNYLQFNIHTTGLPQGAYTVWWVIFNEPGDCAGPGSSGGVCGLNDLGISTNSVVWATGKVVKANGVGNFSDRIYVGELRSETIILGTDLNSPLENPQTAEVHLIVKYHGLASEDPDVLDDQLHTLLGNCGADEGANSYDAGPGFGIQCFDPHVAVFPVN